jgi:hypothetical protein
VCSPCGFVQRLCPRGYPRRGPIWVDDLTTELRVKSQLRSRQFPHHPAQYHLLTMECAQAGHGMTASPWTGRQRIIRRRLQHRDQTRPHSAPVSGIRGPHRAAARGQACSSAAHGPARGAARVSLKKPSRSRPEVRPCCPSMVLGETVKDMSSYPPPIWQLSHTLLDSPLHRAGPHPAGPQAPPLTYIRSYSTKIRQKLDRN